MVCWQSLTPQIWYLLAGLPRHLLCRGTGEFCHMGLIFGSCRWKHPRTMPRPQSCFITLEAGLLMHSSVHHRKCKFPSVHSSQHDETDSEEDAFEIQRVFPDRERQQKCISCAECTVLYINSYFLWWRLLWNQVLFFFFFQGELNWGQKNILSIVSIFLLPQSPKETQTKTTCNPLKRFQNFCSKTYNSEAVAELSLEGCPTCRNRGLSDGYVLIDWILNTYYLSANKITSHTRWVP